MAEYIKCRNCESFDCKGCNLKNLETMLNNGKFDCLMNGNRCVNPSDDVSKVRHGRWICIRKGYEEYECSVCHGMDSNCSDYYADHVVTEQDYCPFCGAKMDLEQFGKDELFQESKGENENDRF